MTNHLIGFVIVLMIVLIVVVASFAVLDRMLKGGTNKVAEKKSAPKKTPAEIPTEEPAAVKTLPAMNIYNSELADDLNAMIKNSNQNTPARLQIENHINKESNITKYLQSKNYRGFDFGDDETVTDDTEQPLTFTREDYKRIVALSNIDDKKPL